MGFDNILEHQGLGIAATGMIIVFAALTLITVFIAMLPRILALPMFGVPPDELQPVASRSRSTGEDEVAAAIGFALHQVELQKKRRG